MLGLYELAESGGLVLTGERDRSNALVFQAHGRG